MASRAVACCTPTPTCARAQAKLAQVETWRDEAEIAQAAYERPPSPTLPKPPRTANYTLVEPGDLGDVGLSPDDLKIDGTNFGAVIYKRGRPPGYVAAFRGTEEWFGSDMVANYEQAMDKKTGGAPTAYYSRAQLIATNMAIKAQRAGAAAPKFIGHSLGGGLASAAAAATGSPATTFNAAGLNPGTVIDGIKQGAEVAAVHVRGEFLTTMQQMSPLANAYGIPYPLDPPFHFGRDLLAQVGGAVVAGPWGLAGAEAVRSGLLHKMGNVVDSLDRAIKEANDNVTEQCGGS